MHHEAYDNMGWCFTAVRLVLLAAMVCGVFLYVLGL